MHGWFRHAALAAGLFAAMATYDTVRADEPFALSEFVFEDSAVWLLIAATSALATYALSRLRETLAERNGLAGALAQAKFEGNRWRQTARVHAEGLGQAIRRQFDQWHLSASECDVAMLMLKGLSHKEIAGLRNSSAATVRQQAAAVYLKSGLSSRAELAAFFLEDLFPGVAERPAEIVPAAANSQSYIGHMPASSRAYPSGARCT